MAFVRPTATPSLPHVVELVQRQGVPRFRSEADRASNYPNPEPGAMSTLGPRLQRFNGSLWVDVDTTISHINALQDVNALIPNDGDVLTWSAMQQAWIARPLPVVPGTGWCDEFDRADGPLGSDWVLGPRIGWIEQATAFTIDGGAIVGTVAFDPAGSGTISDSTNLMHWAAAQGDNQFIEVEFGADTWRSGTEHVYCMLFTHLTDSSAASAEVVDVVLDLGYGTVTCGAMRFNPVAYPGSVTSYFDTVDVAHTTGVPVTVRFESDADGTGRLFVDGTLALTYTDPAPVTGPFIGLSVHYELGEASPHVLKVCGGTL